MEVETRGDEKARRGEPAGLTGGSGGDDQGGSDWGGSPWGATGWGTTGWGTATSRVNGAGASTVSTDGEDATYPGDRIDSVRVTGRVESGEFLASRKDDEMTEMESEVPAAGEEQVAPDAPGPEPRPGRHYRNEGDTGQFTRILGDAPRPTEGTRRHRYREDDEENEVLTRILGH
jgi:hypothetical protein